MLKNQLRPAVVLTLLFCVITGLVYPGVVTALTQLLFPHRANGSLIQSTGGRVIGSELIGQPFARPEYFHPRPSAAGSGYDGTASGGSNKGPTDVKLADTLIAQAVDSAVKLDGGVKGKIPSDLVTASGSGLDPHISPASALLQVSRVARARGLDSAVVQALVERHSEHRQLGLLGEPRVNVLLLNLALDSIARIAVVR
jgi:potassium-transporting ATPase KdpC subunit